MMAPVQPADFAKPGSDPAGSAPRSAGPDHIRAVERWTLIFSAVLLTGALLLGGARTQLGVAVGAGLMVLNTWVMRRLGTRLLLTLPKAKNKRASFLSALVLFNGKLLLLCALIYLCLRYLPVDPLAFVLGVSVLPAAIVARAIQHGLSPADSAADDIKPNAPHGEG